MCSCHVTIIKEYKIGMMTIRKAQIDALSVYVRKSFEQNSANYLKMKYLDKTRNMNGEEILQFIRQGIEKAAGYNINERNDILPFLEYMFCYGNDFETNPANEWATEIFNISNLPGDEIIIRLRNNKPL